MSLRNIMLRAAAGNGGAPVLQPTINAFTEYNGTLRPWSITKPAGAVSGDLLVFLMGSGDGKTWISQDGLSTLWRQESTSSNTPVGFYRRLDASDNARTEYSFDASGGGGINIAMTCLLIKNGAIDIFGNMSGAGPNAVAPSINVTDDNSLLIDYASADSGVSLVTAPAGMTLLDNNAGTSNVQNWIFTRTANAGASGTATVSTSGNNKNTLCSIKPYQQF